MKRTEFIEQLRDLLREVDQDEKEEALQYYEDYLEEAGILENAEVPETFGTPQRVAQTVRNGLNGRFEQEAKFTERGFQEFEEQKNLVDSFGGIVKSENQTYQEGKRGKWQEKDKRAGIRLLKTELNALTAYKMMLKLPKEKIGRRIYVYDISGEMFSSSSDFQNNQEYS